MSKIIEEQFDKLWASYDPSLDTEGLDFKIKIFITDTIKQIRDEVVGEEMGDICDEDCNCGGGKEISFRYRNGYNQKRQRDIEIFNKYL